jgi:hypothetical protein
MSWDALRESTVARSDDAMTAVVAAITGVPVATVERPLQAVRAAHPGRMAARKAERRTAGLLGVQAHALEEAALDLGRYQWLSEDHKRAISDCTGWERRDLVRRLVWSRLSEEERLALRTDAMTRHGHSGAAVHAFDIIRRRFNTYSHLVDHGVAARIASAETDEARRLIREHIWGELDLDTRENLVSEGMGVIGVIGVETHGIDLLLEELVEYEHLIEPEDVARILSARDVKERRTLVRDLLWSVLDDIERGSLITRATSRLGRLGYVWIISSINVRGMKVILTCA